MKKFYFIDYLIFMVYDFVLRNGINKIEKTTVYHETIELLNCIIGRRFILNEKMNFYFEVSIKLMENQKVLFDRLRFNSL